LDEKDRFLASSRRVGLLPAELRTYVACAATLAEPSSEYVVRIEPENKRVKFFAITSAKDSFPVTDRQIIVDLKKQSVFDQTRRRILVRKADLMGMSSRSKQRPAESNARQKLAIGNKNTFVSVDPQVSE